MNGKIHILKIGVPLFIAVGIIFLNTKNLFPQIQYITFQLLQPFARTATSLRMRLDPQARNSSVIQDNQTVQALRFEIEQLKQENTDLKEQLEFKKTSGLTLRGARVLLYLREPGKESFLIDQGEEAGIQEEDWVLDHNHNIIGKISHSKPGFSKVNIASNPGNTYQAELVSYHIPVLAEGVGDGTFSIRLIPQNTPLKTDDFVSLAGNQRFQTFLLGKITSFRAEKAKAFQEAYAISLARPELEKEVFVVSKLEK